MAGGGGGGGGSSFPPILVPLMALQIDNPVLYLIPRGGGGGTASLKVGTHCQTTAPAFCPCPPLSFL